MAKHLFRDTTYAISSCVVLLNFPSLFFLFVCFFLHVFAYMTSLFVSNLFLFVPVALEIHAKRSKRGRQMLTLMPGLMVPPWHLLGRYL